MKRFFALLILFAAILLFAAPLEVRKGVRANPKLRIERSCAGDLGDAVTNFIRASNYFDLAPAGQAAEYTLTLRGTSGAAEYSLVRAGAAASSGTLTGGDAREVAKALVDKILKDVFQVKLLCRTKIAFCGETERGVRNIILCDIDGRNARQLTYFRSSCVEPSFFPDGRSICYTKYGHSGTDVLETTLDPVRTRRLTAFPGLNTGVAIDPTRRYMSLILSRDKQIELYVKEIANRNLRRLTRDDAVEASPCWSPDGRTVCYVSDKSGKPQLYLADLVQGRVTRLETAGSEAYTPDWSPGGKIAYVCRIDGLYMLAVYDTMTGRTSVVPNLSGSWESPSWAPDNRHLVCSRSEGRGARSQVHVVDTWTGRDRVLVRSGANASMPSWSRAAVR